MKLRMLAIGCTLTSLEAALISIRGVGPGYIGLSLVGLALLVLGFLWK